MHIPKAWTTRPHRKRLVMALVLSIILLSLPVAYVYATTIIGQAAGAAGDGDPSTFKFRADNS